MYQGRSKVWKICQFHWCVWNSVWDC